MKQLKTSMLMTMMLCMSAILLYSQPPSPTCNCNLGTCTGSLGSLNYNSANGWSPYLSFIHSMGVNGRMGYYSTAGGNYNRMVTGTPVLAPQSLNFIAECNVAIDAGNAPGHYVFAFTAKEEDPVCTDAVNYPLTNNDALAVVIKKEGAAPTSINCCPNPCATERWLLQIMAKDGATAPVFSAGIPVGCQFPLNYYVRLVRSNCWTYLGVYSDPGFTTHIAGSPVCMMIPTTITGFQKIQHGVITSSSIYSTVAMSIDNTRICPYTSGCTPAACGLSNTGDGQTRQIQLGNEINKDQYISITPNPSSGLFTLDIANADEAITSIAIYDLNGKIYKLIDKVDNIKNVLVNGSELKNGAYLVEAYGKTKTWKSTIVIQR